jgi:Protein of unknown function (DUF2442)
MRIPKIQTVQVLPDHCLGLRFDNGEVGSLDIKPYLDFGVFSRLRDPVVFAQVAVRFDTVEWPHGVDLDPAFVYEKSIKNRPHAASHA